MKFISTLLVAGAAFVAATPAPDAGHLDKRTLPSTSTNATLIAALLNAATGRQRVALLTNDDDFTYDYQNPPTTQGIANGTAGRVVTGNRNTFPGVIGTGSSMSVGFLAPCGLNTPHVHPRGTELNIVVQGNLVSNFILENGARVVHHNSSIYQMITFPQGALHTEYNPNCTPSVFVAAFNNEDAATLAIADAFFALDENIIKAALGSQYTKTLIAGQDIDTVRAIIPANVARGVEECLNRCGLAKRAVDVKVKRAIDETIEAFQRRK